MTNKASRAGRALVRLRRSYTITCEVCGKQATKRDPRARICGGPHCTYVQRKRRENTLKEAQQ